MTILIVDDDEALAYFLKDSLEDAGHEAWMCNDPVESLGLIDERPYDLLLLDNKMPGMSGMELFAEIRERGLSIPTIIMTAYGTTDTTIEAIKQGAFDYIEKPFDIDTLHTVLKKVKRQRKAKRRQAEPVNPGETIGGDVLIGKSEIMRDIYKKIGHIAQSNANVLIVGESGTGKDLIANAIVKHSQRSDQPFVALNCAAIPETLLESELFGYEKGAFTGAAQQRSGKLEKAHTGTLFLDEIGDMSPASQAKILRVLQGQSFERVGGQDPIQVDIRVIAASNKDLEEEKKAGNFREDLFYRLSTFVIKVPPLRERGEDIIEIAEHFIHYYSSQYKRAVPEMTSAFRQALKNYSWPGNVRQLRHAVHRAIVMAKGDVLDEGHFIIDEYEPARETADSVARIYEQTLKRFLDEYLYDDTHLADVDIPAQTEAVYIRHVLTLTGYHQVKTAQLLGISRTTLQKKIKQYGLDR